MSIHPTAVLDPQAAIDPTAQIGPFCVVGPNVSIARNVVLHSHVHIGGHTEIGEETEIYPFACLGEPPQDLKYRGEASRLAIGARNRIREHVTIHPGTAGGGGVTSVGDDNLIMIGSHIGHDCRVGSRVVMSNNVQLAGHVEVGDHCVLYAGAAVQPFLRIGESVFLAAKAGVMQDLAPFTWCQGHPARVLRVNRVGLERRGLDPDEMHMVERALGLIFLSKLRPREAFAKTRSLFPESGEVERLVAFLEKSERGFARVRA